MIHKKRSTGSGDGFSPQHGWEPSPELFMVQKEWGGILYDLLRWEGNRGINKIYKYISHMFLQKTNKNKICL